jgi:hypothetical protein
LVCLSFFYFLIANLSEQSFANGWCRIYTFHRIYLRNIYKNRCCKPPLYYRFCTALVCTKTGKFKFNEGISFVVYCDTQAEIDYMREKLSAGGEPGQCGWLKDKFGLSWQIVPRFW